MARIVTGDGEVSVPCEPINEWLAITAVFGMDAEGKTGLDGRFSIVHLPTGKQFSDGLACLTCCQNAGKAITAMDIDWAAFRVGHEAEWVEALGEETRSALGIARSVEWGCNAEDCEPA